MRNQKLMFIQVFFHKGLPSFQSTISSKIVGKLWGLESELERGGPVSVSEHVMTKQDYPKG